MSYLFAVIFLIVGIMTFFAAQDPQVQIIASIIILISVICFCAGAIISRLERILSGLAFYFRGNV